MKLNFNKTVLLHERKKHTSRRVASTRSTVLSEGVGGGGEGTPGQGYPSHLGLVTGVPHRNDIGPVELLWDGDGNPHPCLGLGYPPGKGPGTSHWGTPPERTWDQWNYYGMEMG